MSSLKTDEEIEKLLTHTNNALSKVEVLEVKIIGSGNHGNHDTSDKRAGNQDRDKESHATIGALATLIGNKATSEIFDVDKSAVSKYKNGKNANNVIDVELRSRLDEKLGKINEKAVDKVDLLLDIFSEDKMLELKPSDIPSAAEKLIAMFDKINRRNDKNLGENIKPQVILYAPQQVNIEHFETKEV